MRYTEEQKNEAISLAEQIGALKASEQLKVSYQSLLMWKKKKAQGAQNAASAEGAEHAENATEKKVRNSSKANQPLELEVQILRNEVAQLKKQLVKQSNAIQALSKVDEQD